MNKDYCEICGSSARTIAYFGQIRDGAYGNTTKEPQEVCSCSGCGVFRLDAPALEYADGQYRENYQHVDPNEYYRNYFNAMPLSAYSGKTMLDIGAGDGTFIMAMDKYAQEVFAVEPNDEQRASLKREGIKTYQSVSEAADNLAGKIDVVTCFSVIEHVKNPRELLQQAAGLLHKDSVLVLSTPNRKDIHMGLIPLDYAPFFYRTAHRWYFDAESLEKCLNFSGLNCSKIAFAHRFGIENTFKWLHDRVPGKEGLGAFGAEERIVADTFWVDFLESIGRSDYIYAHAELIHENA